MTAIVRIQEGLYTPMVEAKAVLPLPPLPDVRPIDVAGGGEIVEMELLTVRGPASVVASAVDALGAYLDELVPVIGKLYDDHEGPQHGG
ncbi:hypothetical protein ACNAW0_00590 [Micromonospora sp. SL1-18]|uniref:hypothetical protein n=1 Tax=Micromonospora sp. SL1-18 TaxID=3399128 RepID=UPI003A4D2F5B